MQFEDCLDQLPNTPQKLSKHLQTKIFRGGRHRYTRSGGGGAIRTLERETLTDLQSASFSHLDTPPN